MEIVEKGGSQPRISGKRIKFQEIVENVEEDRISVLPDCVLIEILSRLPSTKNAIRTGSLSKRWEHLWTSVHTLIFSEQSYYTLPLYLKNPNSIFDFFSSVDKTLTQRRQLNLKKFELYTGYDNRFESQVNNWIRYAVSCNVEELNLNFWYIGSDKFPLDQNFFINTCFTDLTLSWCMFDPTRAISWKKLKSLCITCGKLDKKLIENILCGSPVWETLVLESCYGYRGVLDITSKSVKKLVFSGYLDPEYNGSYAHIIEINAPNILSLTIKGDLHLWKLLLINLSSLVEANLNYKKIWRHKRTHDEEMLKEFILNLRHVKELKFGVCCSQDLSRLKRKNQI